MPIEGQILSNKYRLEQFLGSGGFASVWAARNVTIDRLVALKILADTLARKPTVVARFLQEARLASRQIHETIVRVEDIGQTEEGVPYLVMDLLVGRSLGEVIERSGRPPFSEALIIIRTLLTGIAAAHRRGIIHRDLKPANIFLMAPGEAGPAVRILDLGLAKDLADDQGLTVSGTLMGTPDYLAPEVLLSPGRAAWTPAADVFACGMVAYNLLTGRSPFGQSDPDIGGALRFTSRAEYYRTVTELPGPAAEAVEVPPAIDAVIRRALALSPADRFKDAEELLAAYDAASGGDRFGSEIPGLRQLAGPSLAPDRSLQGRPTHRRGSPFVWIAVGALGAALIGTFVSLVLGREPPERARANEEGQLRQAVDHDSAQPEVGLGAARTELSPSDEPAAGLGDPDTPARGDAGALDGAQREAIQRERSTRGQRRGSTEGQRPEASRRSRPEEGSQEGGRGEAVYVDK